MDSGGSHEHVTCMPRSAFRPATICTTMALPAELWYFVADHLRGDQKSLSRLCQLDTQLYLIVLPVLYEKVHLGTSSSISLFCKSVLSNTRKLPPLVSSLQIGDYIGSETYDQSRLHKGLAKPFRALLGLLFNLRSLYLATTATAFNICFSGLEAPFKLRRLAIPSVNSGPFYAFLCEQSMVTELHLLPAPVAREDAVKAHIHSHPDILQCCKSATATARLLSAIIPSRQISDVVLMDNLQGLQSTDLYASALDGVFALLENSSIFSIGSYHFHVDKNPWEVIILMLKAHRLHTRIEKLKFIGGHQVFILQF
jgi:hypothetical protein